MSRRELIAGIAGTFALPPVSRAQKEMPVVGFLQSQFSDGYRAPLRGFREGLKESGYIEGENVLIEYRWAENQTDRLPALAAELVQRRVAVIAALDSPTAVAAKAATKTIAVVFNSGEDPVRLGLAASLARPGGNLTGINFFAAELGAKRLELLLELIPGVSRIAVLVNPAHASITESTLLDVRTAAPSMGLELRILNASTDREIDVAFATAANERLDAVLLGSGPFFSSRRTQLAMLAAYQRIPAMYTGRQYVEGGGLMSYGTSLADAWRQAGVYVGRILKGAKPDELPIVQSSKFELAINLQTARMLGLTIPPTLLARADEVIE